MRLTRPRISFPSAVAGAAVALVLTSGVAYAVDEWTGANIVNGTILSADIKNDNLLSGDIKNATIIAADLADAAVSTAKLADGSVTSAKVLDDTEVGGGLGSTDLATNSVAQSEIATDGVGATEIQDNSIDAGEIVDFGLTNQDIGVLFAQVSATGVLDNSSGGVTVTKLTSAGNYEVDFGRNISSCAFNATIGPSGGGSSNGEVTVADRSGNTEAVFVDTNDTTGAAADRPFHLLVVC